MTLAEHGSTHVLTEATGVYWKPVWHVLESSFELLRAQQWRLRARRGPKQAPVAVAASTLTAASHILRDGVEYADLGADRFDRRRRRHTVKHLVRRLEDLGFAVTITPAAGPSAALAFLLATLGRCGATRPPATRSSCRELVEREDLRRAWCERTAVTPLWPGRSMRPAAGGEA